MEYNENQKKFIDEVANYSLNLQSTINGLQSILNNSKSVMTAEQQTEIDKVISENKFSEVQNDLNKVSEMLNNLRK